jgi:hypothetical protein
VGAATFRHLLIILSLQVALVVFMLGKAAAELVGIKSQLQLLLEELITLLSAPVALEMLQVLIVLHLALRQQRA